jgi:DNA-binding SARP family transcriptional activator
MTLPQGLRREATINGVPVKLSPRRHALLELLLLSPPSRLVGVEEIVERLWPDPDLQPLGALDCLHIYIMQLRRLGVPIEGQHGRGWRIPEYARGTAWKQAA